MPSVDARPGIEPGTAGASPAPVACEQADLPALAALLARAMRDNPLHLATLGADPALRQERLQRFFALLLPHVLAHGRLLATWHEGRPVGVMGWLEPGRCQPDLRATLRLLGRLWRALPPRVLLRTLCWLYAWHRRDLQRAHLHLGPLAVDPAWRGHGLGGALLRRALAAADARALPAWLETDLMRNVAWYRRCGFRVEREARILGTASWFMRREPGGRA